MSDINNKNDYILWTEKYRPKTLETYLGNKELVKLIREWIEKHRRKEYDVERFLILHGSPGVGKTTLAHIIYNTYDYDIIECNASEQRSKKKVAEKIGTIGKVSVCYDANIKGKQIGVIMDEIDGVAGGDKGAIDELIKILEGKKQKKQNKQTKQTKQTKQNNQKKQKKQDVVDPNIIINQNGIKIDKSIKFPVICTCNSIKDRKLQTLIRKSLVININKPTPANLNKLAKKIINNENININKKDLTEIVMSSKKDYRTLISNLYQYSLNNSINLLNKTKDEIALEEVSCEKPLVICNYILNKSTFDYEIFSKLVEGDEHIFFLNIYSNYLKLLNYNRVPRTKAPLIQQISDNICFYDNCKRFFYINSHHGYPEKYYIMVGIIHNLMLLKQMIKKNKYPFEHHSTYNYYLQAKSSLMKKINVSDNNGNNDNDDNNDSNDNIEDKEYNTKSSSNFFYNYSFNNNSRNYKLAEQLHDYKYIYLKSKKDKSKDKINGIINKILE